ALAEKWRLICAARCSRNNERTLRFLAYARNDMCSILLMSGKVWVYAQVGSVSLSVIQNGGEAEVKNLMHWQSAGAEPEELGV
ncbi:hypothetical protein, partial [Luoshenia tenuis]|uniref:hypothetical protein n=1 Tax=Luoshenia tenuis TaxID=2763654 RepID=UPI003D90C102